MAPPSESDSDTNQKSPSELDEEKLVWIQLRKDIGSSAPVGEGLKEKFIRKTKENPFVPIGCFATAGVLTYGLWCMKSGDTRRSQLMMRFRIGAQAFTIGALLVGIVYSTFKPAA